MWNKLTYWWYLLWRRDYTEECRDALPEEAGDTDFPFDGSESLEMMQEDWVHPPVEGACEFDGG